MSAPSNRPLKLPVGFVCVVLAPCVFTVAIEPIISSFATNVEPVVPVSEVIESPQALFALWSRTLEVANPEYSATLTMAMPFGARAPLKVTVMLLLAPLPATPYHMLV